MLQLGLLKEFENIVLMELGETLPRTLWNATHFFFEIKVFENHHRTRPLLKSK